MASMTLRSLGPCKALHAAQRLQPLVLPHMHACDYRQAVISNGQTATASTALHCRAPHQMLFGSLALRRCTGACGVRAAARAGYATASTNTVQEVTQTMSYLRNLQNGAEVWLVGTAHISKQSAEEVRQLIRRIKPDVVFVELCESRGRALRSKDSKKPFDVMQELLGAAFGGPGGLFQALMKGFYKALELVGFESGGEFKAAVEEAERSRAKLVLGDRDVNETVRRITHNFTFQDLMSLFVAPPQQPSRRGSSQQDTPHGSFSTLFGPGGPNMVEAMKNRKAVRALVASMKAANPKMAKVLLQERDEYMAKELVKQEGKVVAVVGMAHMDGIEQWWDKLQTSQALDS